MVDLTKAVCDVEALQTSSCLIRSGLSNMLRDNTGIVFVADSIFKGACPFTICYFLLGDFAFHISVAVN